MLSKLLSFRQSNIILVRKSTSQLHEAAPKGIGHPRSSLSYLEEVVQAAQVAAGAEVGLVEVLEEQDKGAVPWVLAGAQLLGDGEELALHLRAVEQQHRPEDKGTAVRLGRQAQMPVAQEILGQIHTRWQWPLVLVAVEGSWGYSRPNLQCQIDEHPPACPSAPPLLPHLQYHQHNDGSISPKQGFSSAASCPAHTVKRGIENQSGPQNIFPLQSAGQSIALGYKEKSHTLQLHFCSGSQQEYPQALSSQTRSLESSVLGGEPSTSLSKKGSELRMSLVLESSGHGHKLSISPRFSSCTALCPAFGAFYTNVATLL